jgi:hypothetical protein
MDWSRSKTLTRIKKGEITSSKSLIEAISSLPDGCIIVLESTAESFELQNRQAVLDMIHSKNIEARCFSPRHTSRYRMKWGIPKSDEIDVEVIYRIFTEENLTCSKFKQIIDKEQDKLRIYSQKALIKDRRYEGEESLKMIEKYLPDFSKVPLDLQECIYKPTKAKNPRKRTPRIQVPRYLIIARAVRDAGRGYRTYRRLIGNYGNGFGSMARSEFNYHHVGSICDARVKNAGIERTFKEGDIDPKTRERKNVPHWTEQEYKIHKDTLKDTSRVVKWLWNLTGSQCVSTIAPTNYS